MQAMAELEPTRAISKWLIAGARLLGAGARVSQAEWSQAKQWQH